MLYWVREQCPCACQCCVPKLVDDPGKQTTTRGDRQGRSPLMAGAAQHRTHTRHRAHMGAGPSVQVPNLGDGATPAQGRASGQGCIIWRHMGPSQSLRAARLAGSAPGPGPGQVPARADDDSTRPLPARLSRRRAAAPLFLACLSEGSRVWECACVVPKHWHWAPAGVLPGLAKASHRAPSKASHPQR